MAAVRAHAYRRTKNDSTKARGVQWKQKDENETKQNKGNTTGERQHDIRPEDTSSRHLWLINYLAAWTGVMQKVSKISDKIATSHPAVKMCQRQSELSSRWQLEYTWYSFYRATPWIAARIRSAHPEHVRTNAPTDNCTEVIVVKIEMARASVDSEKLLLVARVV